MRPTQLWTKLLLCRQRARLSLEYQKNDVLPKDHSTTGNIFKRFCLPLLQPHFLNFKKRHFLFPNSLHYHLIYAPLSFQNRDLAKLLPPDLLEFIFIQSKNVPRHFDREPKTPQNTLFHCHSGQTLKTSAKDIIPLWYRMGVWHFTDVCTIQWIKKWGQY